MGGLLGGSTPKPVTPPPVPPPLPIPEPGPEAGEQARKRRPRGRRATFLTGDLIPTEQELKKKQLG